MENGEGLQLLHYQATELYEPHFDYFHDDKNVKNGGQRIATMLMYLTDVQSGGETVFPTSVEKPVSPTACSLSSVRSRKEVKFARHLTGQFSGQQHW